MKIVTLLHQASTKQSLSTDDILGVYEDINDAITMKERFEKMYPRMRFWLEDFDVTPTGGLVDE